MKTTEYRCNLCGDKKAESDLIGFKFDSAGAPMRIRPQKAINHICEKCISAVSSFSSLPLLGDDSADDELQAVKKTRKKRRKKNEIEATSEDERT